MKNKLFTFLLMLFVVALMTGCGKGSNPNETTSNNAMEKPSNSYVETDSTGTEGSPSETTSDNATEKPSDSSVETGSAGTEGSSSETTSDNATEKPSDPYIEIYPIRREEFQLFLTEPTMEKLSIQDPKIYGRSSDTQRHIRGSLLFTITSDLIDFAADQTKIKDFLAQNEIHCDVIDAVLLDSPRVPITIWVRTDQESAFITINEEWEEDYTYRCYTLSSFKEKFSRIQGSLNVNGKNIPTDIPVKIYSDYADVPLLPVLEAFGAEIDRKSDGQFAISFLERQYILDIKHPALYAIEDESANILYEGTGGPTFVYREEQDVMVDTAVLATVMDTLGLTIGTTCDRTNRVVTVRLR